eukprot:TRINITY_DN10085_c0_g1_i1.p1 TRINITY_DN10085_c0_g1~~TRINITY_DN10085_c0_g1_i1.p1  ORF type:complete len:264 (+),score=5.25 TRINITY_DN10085_c0_g1_i1:148-939(+)
MIVLLLVNYGNSSYVDSGHALYAVFKDTYSDYRKLFTANSVLCEFLATKGEGLLNNKPYLEGVQQILQNRYQFAEYKNMLLKNAHVLPDVSSMLDEFFSSKNICKDIKYCEIIFEGAGTKGAGLFLTNNWEKVSLLLNLFLESPREDEDITKIVSSPEFKDLEAAEDLVLETIYGSIIAALQTAFYALEANQLSLVYVLLYSLAAVIIVAFLLVQTFLLRKISHRVSEIKLYFKILPVEYISKSKYIRRYLVMTSPETLIGTK